MQLVPRRVSIPRSEEKRNIQWQSFELSHNVLRDASSISSHYEISSKAHSAQYFHVTLGLPWGTLKRCGVLCPGCHKVKTETT